MACRRSFERERFWRGMIRDQAASGLSISAFCRERKTATAGFFRWRRNLAERRREEEAVSTNSADKPGDPTPAPGDPTPVPADPASRRSRNIREEAKNAAAKNTAATNAAAKNAAAKFVSIEFPSPAAEPLCCEVVLPGGCRILVPAQFDAESLREILGVLRERPC